MSTLPPWPILGGRAVQSHVSGHQMVMLPGTNECPVKAQHLLFWGDLSESSPQCAHMDLLLYSFRRYSPQQGTSVGLSLHSFVGVLQAPALLAAAGRGGAAEGKAGRQAFLGLTSSRKGGPERRSPVLAQHGPFVSWSLPLVRAAGWPKSAEVGQSQGRFPLRLQNLPEPRQVFPCSPP